ncbi:MAG TPA: GntR family transcriptional regulator [Geminicoccus sp.]|uniref:GntR family transcriptional regulator n=1 Tax=Geminicoccus sp. TaxID=2024832 RepID=UPI002CAADC52|nr:GntR family transcriptional regulator [Geminicoccus sp.]HWL67291.1 GntR family transcriptional regulator [Geminicoccus sp.]
MAIHAHLRDQIVRLVRLPGEPVNEREIAALFGVSRTPVREALLQLASEGLIAMVPQVGTFVARIPANHLPEAVLVRQALEEATARLAAERSPGVDLAGMEAAIDRQVRAAERGAIEEFHIADEAFHATIAVASGYPGIWRLVRRAKLQLDRYRRATLPQLGRLPKVIEQHRAILDAIARHDPEGAAMCMRAHVGALVVDLAAIRALHPDWFTEISEEAGP